MIVFFTGGEKIGRIIAAAAGKLLTPVTLELGGKSPVIIDSNYDIKLAAKRILWGKIANCGQVRRVTRQNTIEVCLTLVVALRLS